MFFRLWSALVLLVTSFQLTTASTPPLQLAYLHGDSYLVDCNGLSVATLDGSPIQTFNFPSITACTPPLWSPDGESLAMATPGLMLLDMESPDIRTIISLDQGVLVSTVMWSQNGDYLVWNERKGDVESWELMDKTTGKIRPFVSLSDIQIAPDEVHYWNSRDDHIQVYRSGQQPQTLQFGDMRLTCQLPMAFRWEDTQMLCGDENDISRANGETQTIVKLTDTPNLQENAFEWSPDGTQIAYQVFDPATRQQWLQVMASDGSNARRLTNPTDDSYDAVPHWSPDGQYIAFERHRGVKGLESKIYVIRVDGSGLQFIDYGVAPSWRPAS